MDAITIKSVYVFRKETINFLDHMNTPKFRYISNILTFLEIEKQHFFFFH